MNITLTQILNLVGTLRDQDGDDTAQGRFRQYLKDNVRSVGQIRDYVEECIRNTGDQYNFALQDLIGHLGSLIGFDVTFGRYRGTRSDIGFDGLWKSPKDFYIVVEVKKTEAYSIDPNTLLGYINKLVSNGTISDPDKALGLYVVGDIEPSTSQLENSIIGLRKTNELRIISTNSLLSLAELFTEYDVSHEKVLEVVKPSTPTIDHIVDLISELMAQKQVEKEELVEGVVETAQEETVEIEQAEYWSSPVTSDDEWSALDTIKSVVGEAHIYAYGNRTPGRQYIKPGDWICFYAMQIGVVAHAQVASYPENKKHPKIRHPEDYPWVFDLKNVSLYLDNPVAIDAEMRSRMDAFRGRDPNKGWAWFVQATRHITKHDFMLLTSPH